MTKNLKKDLHDIAKQLQVLADKTERWLRMLEKYEKPKAKAVKKAPEKKVVVTKTAPPTAIDKIFAIIKRSKKGISTAALMKKTGYERKAISNVIYKLTKQGKIKSVAKGVYVKA